MSNTYPRYHVTTVKLLVQLPCSRLPHGPGRWDRAVMVRGISQASRSWVAGQVMVYSRSWAGGLNDINREVLGSFLEQGEI